MGLARKYQICVDETPYYHVVSRCVRRAFLCGDDHTTGRSFEHRRKWVVDRMKFLAKLFALDICAYAIMSNHFHIVLKVNSTQDWSDKRVLMTWAGLFDLPLLCERYVRGDQMSNPELEFVIIKADEYRKRLMDISWFMKTLNEYIARRANIEDGCTGHFWESRFKSQALLDERALLTCMAYVDLNPIRAAMAKTPEQSDYTSIQDRINNENTRLIGFGKGDKDLPFSLSGYLELVDYSGRAILENKRGYTPENLPSILDRLGLNPDTWMDELKGFKSVGFSAVGTVDQLKDFCRQVGKKFALGLRLKTVLE
ncbi:transposase [Marinicella meishanensis]|uniref:transposase n=1 Tax=Marinicella meishanensis TaxID=2873263 RepID=UPI001CBC9015|nr:transposase [Marinicella sp. NBU2979]